MNDRKMKVACVGGGQLGRMMALEAPRLNISMKLLDPGGKKSSSAEAIGASNVIEGKLDDYDALKELVKDGCDVVTFEIEHIGVEALLRLQSENPNLNIQPSIKIMQTIQDKLIQKNFFQEHNIPLPPFVQISAVDDIKKARDTLGLPIMLKRRKGGYDGRGNAVLKDLSEESIKQALASLGYADVNEHEEFDLYAEGWIHFQSELAVIVVRSTSGETIAYPAVTAIQQDSICRACIVPARNVSTAQRHKAEAIAAQAISSLGDGATGIFGVELFLDQHGHILLNEVAPRPHNTGHYTQDACVCSQFENHLRAVCGMPLGDTSLIVGAAAMVNILGMETHDETIQSIQSSQTIPRTVLHWYSKSHRKGRKLGHINLTASSTSELDKPLSQLLKYQKALSSTDANNLLHTSPSPLVAVIMGSKSDLPTMQAAVNILKQFDIPHEVDIVSAHRTPEKMMTYAQTASNRGLEVIIAGAGGAAHLPGMVAALTPLPVVGVPIKTSTLNGQDSLLSIVQMPRGIPVATVAIGNAMNAGLLAVRILSTSRRQLREKMEEYQIEMKDKVDMDSEELLSIGSDKFLSKMDNKNLSVNV